MRHDAGAPVSGAAGQPVSRPQRRHALQLPGRRLAQQTGHPGASVGCIRLVPQWWHPLRGRPWQRWNAASASRKHHICLCGGQRPSAARILNLSQQTVWWRCAGWAVDRRQLRARERQRMLHTAASGRPAARCIHRTLPFPSNELQLLPSENCCFRFPALLLQTLLNVVEKMPKPSRRVDCSQRVQRTKAAAAKLPRRLLPLLLVLHVAAAPQATLAAHEGPTWIELISWKPRTFLLHELLSPQEADYIVAVASPSLQRSTVVARNGSSGLD